MEDTFTEVEIGQHERLSLTIWQRFWSAVYGARWGLTRGWNLLSFLVLPRSLKPENIIECPENKPKTLIHLPSDQLVFRNNYHLVKSTLPVSCSWQNVRNILSFLLLLRYLKPWIKRECPENKLQTLNPLSSDQKRFLNNHNPVKSTLPSAVHGKTFAIFLFFLVVLHNLMP